MKLMMLLTKKSVNDLGDIFAYQYLSDHVYFSHVLSCHM